MTTIGVTMVKDEADVIEHTLRHMATQVDGIVIADNMSTDGTWETICTLELDVPLVRRRDLEPGYYQSRKMTWLSRIAIDLGAEWIVPFDADEYWYSPFAPRVADYLEGQVAPQWLAVAAHLYDHVSTACDIESFPPHKRIGWRRIEPAPLPKMAGRARKDMVIEMGNHSITYDGGTTVQDGGLVVRHFPYRSDAQFVSKVRNGAAAYKAATQLGQQFGEHWRQYGAFLAQHGEQHIIDEIYHRWFYSEHPTEDPTLIFDPAPV